MIVAVVLAAGASSRMGSPKALLQIGGISLIEAHIEVLLSVCSEVVVVVGAHKNEISPLCERARVRVVVNENWADSDSLESLKVGIGVLSVVDRVVVTPVDAPPVRISDLRALVDGEVPAVLSWQGVHGHPVIIGEAEVQHMFTNEVSGGLRSLMSRVRLVPAGAADILCNLNTPELWGSYLAEYSDKK
jgi:molybdenum cofactor cytidylyltransferase